MLLSKILPIAERIRDTLAPYCDQIAIAGSIRRARPECNDIDIVLLPKPGQDSAIRARAKSRALSTIINGPHQMIVRLQTGLQLDLYFTHPQMTDLFTTTPPNWGSVLLCRTGSKEHNIWLAIVSKNLGLHWDPPRGIIPAGGQIVAGATEEDIYHYLGLSWIPPVRREQGYLCAAEPSSLLHPPLAVPTFP